jgi:hypothetical protein
MTEEEELAHEVAVKQLLNTDIGTLLKHMDENDEDVFHFRVDFADKILEVHLVLREGELQ